MPPGLNIAITGSALATSLGCELAAVASRVRDRQRGLTFQHRFADWSAAPLGEIPWTDLGIRVGDPYDSDRLLQLGCHTVLDQLLTSSQLLARVASSRIGLFMGTTTCGINGLMSAARQFAEAPRPFETLLKPQMQQAWIAQELAATRGIRGPVYTLSSSCATSAQAAGLAFDALRAGWIDAAVVIGADVLNLVTICGFASLQILDQDFCKPFAPERAGINLGEAIVAVVLEPGSYPDPRLLGYSAVTEAFHMTQPAPEGLWMEACMRQALARAEVTPASVAYVSPHGTGTEANDAAEGRAVEAVFGDQSRLYPTKAFTGHTLGASGLLELVLAGAMLAGGDGIALKNSFGFGGANVSLVLARGGL